MANDETVICVCCNKTAICIFDDKTALCRTHGINFQTILEHLDLPFHIKIMDYN